MNRTLPVRFFKGLEIEATKHFLQPTMIAPGQYDYHECRTMTIEHNCTHILVGFMYDPAGNPLDMDSPRAFELANRLMDDGIRVTLEIRPDQLTDEFVAACPEPESVHGQLFAILIGTRFPNMPKIGAYTTLKLHSDFGNTENNGVWCVQVPKFREAGIFTPWVAYQEDQWLK
jgi:hypothetical protein